MVVNLAEPVTQGTFAGMIGVAQPAVAAMVAAGTLRDGATAAEWLVAYCRHVRDLAHGRSGGVADARERLLRAQSERVELENRTRAGELVGMRSVAADGHYVGTLLVRELESLPLRLAPQLLGLSHVREVAMRLDRELDELRDRVCTAIEAKYGPEVPDHLRAACPVPDRAPATRGEPE